MSENLLEKAELLMEIEGYEQESIKKNENTIDIKASKPDSDRTVLMHIVTSDNIGVNQARETIQMLEEEEVDKLIVFANKFTKKGKEKLNEENIGFFSEEISVLSAIPLRKLYPTVVDYVNQLCKLKCGLIPKSASDCKGYSGVPIECSSCGGKGKRNGQNRLCNTCGGTGFRNQHYSCKVRLISDNADYHQRKGWINLLQNDISDLIKMMPTEENNGESVNHLLSNSKREVN
jgi:hypothetical protein